MVLESILANLLNLSNYYQTISFTFELRCLDVKIVC